MISQELFAMFVVVILLYLLCETKGDLVRYNCSKIGEAQYMKFTPVLTVPGRYTVELCAAKDPNVTLWDLELFYYEGPRCNTSQKKFKVHSVLRDQFINNPVNCTNVCYFVDFDLIFASCYNIRNNLKNEVRTLHSNVTAFLVQNNLTLNSYRQTNTKVVFIPNEKDVSLRWILNVPIPHKFTVCVKQKKNNSEYSEHCNYNFSVTCAKSNENEILCNLALPMGCYEAELELDPPWYPVLNTHTASSYQFCVEAPTSPVIGDKTGAGSWWVAGAVLLAGGALLAALQARNVLRSREFHERVKQAWLQESEDEARRAAPAAPAPRAHHVLLLYAREGRRGQRAVDALKALLDHAFAGQVQILDVYSAGVVALAAPAPGAWLRGALGGARTKVLLLQSPALLRLHATALTHSSMQLREPLLGRDALYRRPHFGDQLLQMALRLMAESVAAHHQYHKYYLATYRGLEGEVLPALVPYRRYELPHAALALLQDLAPAACPTESPTACPPACPTTCPTECAPACPLLEQLTASADEFIAHALAHPDYLTDELVLL